MKYLSLLISIIGLVSINWVNGCVNIPDECLNAFNKQALNSTNTYRLKHKVGPLIPDQAISNIAIKHSCLMCDNFKFVGNAFRGNLGENLYIFLGITSFSMDAISCANYAKNSVDLWYNDIINYNFKTGGTLNGQQFMSFTQLVWKNTFKVGFSLAFSENKDPYGYYWLSIVSNYYLPGNYPFQYTNNVFPADSN